jgi:hypothetical protein
VVYKVRMVALQDREPAGVAVPITSLDVEPHHR